jgi:hypothetical protein
MTFPISTSILILLLHSCNDEETIPYERFQNQVLPLFHRIAALISS